METKYTTGICFNCGAGMGLHHYETTQCPKNGIEAPLNKKQEWDSRNIFQDSGLVKLHDAAPELLEALEITLKAMLNLSRQIPTNETLADFNFDLCEIAEEKALKAIEKAIKY